MDQLFLGNFFRLKILISILLFSILLCLFKEERFQNRIEIIKGNPLIQFQFFNFAPGSLNLLIFLLPLGKPSLLSILKLNFIKNKVVDIDNFFLIDINALLAYHLPCLYALDIIIQVNIALFLHFTKKIDNTGMHFLNPVHDNSNDNVIS